MNKGQALVVLLFYMIISITLSTAAVAVVLANSLSVTRSAQSIYALEVAETGAENAIIQLIRNPAYTGEILTVSSGTATVSVSGTNSKIVQSVGSVGTFSRSIYAGVTITNGVISITSWQEQ